MYPSQLSATSGVQAVLSSQVSQPAGKGRAQAAARAGGGRAGLPAAAHERHPDLTARTPAYAVSSNTYHQLQPTVHFILHAAQAHPQSLYASRDAVNKRHALRHMQAEDALPLHVVMASMVVTMGQCTASCFVRCVDRAWALGRQRPCQLGRPQAASLGTAASHALRASGEGVLGDR